ncbi:MAG: RNA polymerase sigma-70 factor [Bacteroidales bacterium]|nr:RNA polymerase sigma-70 factor [Bacteroidales bacterium]
MKHNNDTLARIKAGDIKAFEIFFRELYPKLCGFANKYLNDIDLAEEFVQDVFYLLWEKRESLSIESSLKSYIYRTVQNKCLMHIRHLHVVSKHSKEVEMSSLQYNEDVTESIDEMELRNIVDKTLAILPERCRNVFRMNRFEGLKYKEIAEKLSLSVKTIEADMGKALKAFRESLKDYILVD